MIKIGNKEISINSDPFIIAEVGINHNGELQKAFEMIQVAKEAGADCVKFQTFKASEFVGDKSQMFTYKSEGKEVTESMLEMFSRYEFSEKEWHQIKEKCDELGIIFMSTPQNISDLEILLKIGVPALKVGSDDFTNLPLLKSYAETKKTLIVSMGMSDMSEIFESLSEIGTFQGYPTILLLCTSQYPTPSKDVNLLKLKTLANAFPNLILGFSDHSEGPLASSLAVALGAKVFEKHFTLNKNLPGPDHWFSEDPSSLKIWIDNIREANIMLGNGLLIPTEKELEMRVLARRSVVALRDIKAGEVYTAENIGLRRPGNGLPPKLFKNILGFKSSNELEKGSLLTYKDIN